MKNINIYTIVFLAIAAFLSSCEQDFLETKPPSEVMEDFYTSEANAQLAIVGCYDVMGWDGDHNTIPFFFGDIIGRDSHKGGDVGGDQDWMDNLINFTYTADNYLLNTAWTNYYIAINRCNSSMENISAMADETISDEKRALFIAEAKFVRAYFYFELVKTFGSVPLVDHVLAPSEYQQPLANEADIWTFIETDLEEAANVLPSKSEIGLEYYGRATKGAADALRAKAYIYQQKWSEAASLTDAIIAGGDYALMPNYEDVFKLENEHNSEIVFSIEFEESGDGSFGDENEGNMVCVYMTTRSHPFAGIGGWGFNCPTQEFADEFEDDDPRLDATVIRDGETLWSGADQTTFNTAFATNIDAYSNQKYALPPSQLPANAYDAAKNWIVIRYADVLLWNAEAKYYAGGDWQQALLQVRNRVGLDESPYNDIQAIYHERRVELGMEGHRFWDIVRQGRGEEVLGAAGFVEGMHNHFPIPQSQLDLSENW